MKCKICGEEIIPNDLGLCLDCFEHGDCCGLEKL